MDIFLSTKDRKTVIAIPILPPEFTLSSPQSNERFQSTVGELNLIANTRGLKSISFDSFFPTDKLTFSKNESMYGWDFVKEIERLRDERQPFRLIITETSINMLVLIDSFDYGLKSGSKNVYYSIALSEFRDIEVKK